MKVQKQNQAEYRANAGQGIGKVEGATRQARVSGGDTQQAAQSHSQFLQESTLDQQNRARDSALKELLLRASSPLEASSDLKKQSLCWHDLDVHRLPNQWQFFTQGASGSPRDLGRVISKALRSRSQQSGLNEKFDIPFDLVNLNMKEAGGIKPSENAGDAAGNQQLISICSNGQHDDEPNEATDQTQKRPSELQESIQRVLKQNGLQLKRIFDNHHIAKRQKGSRFKITGQQRNQELSEEPSFKKESAINKLKFSSFDRIQSYRGMSSVRSDNLGSLPKNLRFDTNKNNKPRQKVQTMQNVNQGDEALDECGIKLLDDDSVQIISHISNRFSLNSSQNDLGKTMLINKSPRDKFEKDQLARLKFRNSIRQLTSDDLDKKRFKRPSRISLSQLDSKKPSAADQANNNDLDYVKECLVDLYLSVKIRTNHDLSKYNNEKMLEEKAQILTQNTIDVATLIFYIQTSIQILMNMKDEEIFQNFHFRNLCQKCQDQLNRTQAQLQKRTQKVEQQKKKKQVSKLDGGAAEPQENDYFFPFNESALGSESIQSMKTVIEQQLQRYERDNRNNIQNLQQMRLFIEQSQEKIEDQKKEIEAIEKDKTSLSMQNNIIQEKLYQHNKEKTQLLSQYQELQNQNEVTIRTLDIEFKQKQAVINNLEAEKASLTNINSGLQDQLATLKSQNEQFEQQIEALQAEIESLQRQVSKQKGDDDQNRAKQALHLERLAMDCLQIDGSDLAASMLKQQHESIFEMADGQNAQLASQQQYDKQIILKLIEIQKKRQGSKMEVSQQLLDSIIQADANLQQQASPSKIDGLSYSNRPQVNTYHSTGSFSGGKLPSHNQQCSQNVNLDQFIKIENKRGFDQKNHSITEGVQPKLVDQYGVEYSRPNQLVLNKATGHPQHHLANLHVKQGNQKLKLRLTSPNNSHIRSQNNSLQLSNVYQDQSVLDSKQEQISSIISYNQSDKLVSHSKRSTSSLGKLETLAGVSQTQNQNNILDHVSASNITNIMNASGMPDSVAGHINKLSQSQQNIQKTFQQSRRHQQNFQQQQQQQLQQQSQQPRPGSIKRQKQQQSQTQSHIIIQNLNDDGLMKPSSVAALSKHDLHRLQIQESQTIQNPQQVKSNVGANYHNIGLNQKPRTKSLISQQQNQMLPSTSSRQLHKRKNLEKIYSTQNQNMHQIQTQKFMQQALNNLPPSSNLTRSSNQFEKQNLSVMAVRKSRGSNFSKGQLPKESNSTAKIVNSDMILISDPQKQVIVANQDGFKQRHSKLSEVAIMSANGPGANMKQQEKSQENRPPIDLKSKMSTGKINQTIANKTVMLSQVSKQRIKQQSEHIIAPMHSGPLNQNFIEESDQINNIIKSKLIQNEQLQNANQGDVSGEQNKLNKTGQNLKSMKNQQYFSKQIYNHAKSNRIIFTNDQLSQQQQLQQVGGGESTEAPIDVPYNGSLKQVQSQKMEAVLGGQGQKAHLKKQIESKNSLQRANIIDINYNSAQKKNRYQQNHEVQKKKAKKVEKDGQDVLLQPGGKAPVKGLVGDQVPGAGPQHIYGDVKQEDTNRLKKHTRSADNNLKSLHRNHNMSVLTVNSLRSQSSQGTNI